MTTPSPSNPGWFMLAMGLSGGLALFLYGLDQLSEGLKQAAGDTLKTLLTRLTSNRFLGALTGAVVTGILNSSSVTTVLVVGFVTAGVMSLAQSVAVIMGANIGSTVTAQLLAFNLSAYALLPVAVGFFMLFAGRRAALRHWGMIVMGLGLVFYGMGVMSDAMKPLRSHEPFVQALARMENPLLGILGGAVFTGVVQSSAATVGLAIAMAGEGLLTLPAGIALALGANIGTCVTALLAALGKPVEAVRAAAVHVGFNVLGVVIWLPFIGLLARLATAVSPAYHDLDASARLAAEVPRQIANANTLFNLVNTALFIGFTGWFARVATKLVPAREKQGELVAPRFLDQAALPVPAVALEQVRQEFGRLGQIVRGMLIELPEAKAPLPASALVEIEPQAKQVEELEGAIIKFLGSIRQGTLSQKESEIHVALMTATAHLRALADIISDDLVPVVRTEAGKLSPGLDRAVVSELYRRVQQAVELSVRAVERHDARAAEAVLAMSPEVRQCAEELMSRLATGFDTGNPEGPATLRLQTSFVDSLRQIFTLAKRIARTELDPENPVQNPERAHNNDQRPEIRQTRTTKQTTERQNIMKTSHLHPILFSALLVASQCAPCVAGEQPGAAGMPKSREAAMLVTVTASVEAINLSNREVTLKGPRGNEVTFEVDKRVKRLDEVKVGDLVRADYYLSVAAELRAPTADEEKHPLTVIEGAGKAPAGTSPAAGALRQFKVVTTVEEIDLPAQTLTIKGPRGNSMTIRAADPARLAQIKKGDHLLVTYTEALAISLDKADKPGGS